MPPRPIRRRLRSRTRRDADAAGLRVEALEPRRLCAGDVTSRLVGSMLLITGDRQDNRVVVSAVKGGGIAVIGDGTTVNGATTPFVTHQRVTGVVTTLGAGDDIAAFTNNMFAIRLLYPGDVDAIQDVIGAATNGEFWFSLPGGITVAAGAGDDQVFLVGAVGGSFVAHLGPSSNESPSGGNGLTILSSAIPIFGAYRPSVIDGSLVVTGGSGSDAVFTDRTTIGRSVTSSLGGGVNSTFLWRTTVAGDVMVMGTTGADTASFSQCDTAGTIVAALGGGRNQVGVSLGRCRRLIISAGAGVDTVGMAQTVVRDFVQVALGGGDDEVELRTTRARAAFLAGGPGGNALALDAATRGGVRRLRFVRFQTVVG